MKFVYQAILTFLGSLMVTIYLGSMFVRLNSLILLAGQLWSVTSMVLVCLSRMTNVTFQIWTHYFSVPQFTSCLFWCRSSGCDPSHSPLNILRKIQQLEYTLLKLSVKYIVTSCNSLIMHLILTILKLLNVNILLNPGKSGPEHDCSRRSHYLLYIYFTRW